MDEADRQDRAAPAGAMAGAAGEDWLRALALVTGLATLAALGWAMRLRGPWYDEFYTAWVTRPALPFGTALMDHWLPDNHPPLYYALAWASGWTGLSLEAHRALNLGFGGLALGAGGLMVREARSAAARRLGLVLAIVLAGQGAVLVYGAELRSYFASLCAVTLLVLALVLAWLEGAPGGPVRRRVLWGAMLAAFNLHIATSLIAGCLVAAFLGGALLRRDRVLLRWMLGPPLAAGVVLLAVTAVQAPLWEANTRAFWIPPGFFAARWTIQNEVTRMLLANGPALLGAIAGLALAALAALRERRRAPEVEAALLLGLGCAAGMAVLLAIHLALRPFVVERYLVGLAGPLVLAMALGLTALGKRLPRRGECALYAAVTAASLFALYGHMQATIAKAGWDGSARAVAAKVAACPDSPVHLDPQWNADVLALPPADNREVVRFAYRTMAERFGFRIEPAASRRVSATCPTLFWAEHGTRIRPEAEQVLAAERARGFALPGLTQEWIGVGWVAEAPPLR
jgi:hypothetical protein